MNAQPTPSAQLDPATLQAIAQTAAENHTSNNEQENNTLIGLPAGPLSIILQNCDPQALSNLAASSQRLHREVADELTLPRAQQSIIDYINTLPLGPDIISIRNSTPYTENLSFFQDESTREALEDRIKTVIANALHINAHPDATTPIYNAIESYFIAGDEGLLEELTIPAGFMILRNITKSLSDNPSIEALNLYLDIIDILSRKNLPVFIRYLIDTTGKITASVDQTLEIGPKYTIIQEIIARAAQIQEEARNRINNNAPVFLGGAAAPANPPGAE